MLRFLALAPGAHSSGSFTGQTFTLVEVHSPSLDVAEGMDDAHPSTQSCPFCSLPESSP